MRWIRLEVNLKWNLEGGERQGLAYGWNKRHCRQIHNSHSLPGTSAPTSAPFLPGHSHPNPLFPVQASRLFLFSFLLSGLGLITLLLHASVHAWMYTHTHSPFSPLKETCPIGPPLGSVIPHAENCWGSSKISRLQLLPDAG